MRQGRQGRGWEGEGKKYGKKVGKGWVLLEGGRYGRREGGKADEEKGKEMREDKKTWMRGSGENEVNKRGVGV